MSIYRGANVRKQITVYADDAEDLQIIAAFLKKYADVISQYVTRKRRPTNDEREVEVDLEEKNEKDENKEENEEQSEEQNEEQTEEGKKQKKSTKKGSKNKKFNIEDEF